MTKLRNTNNQKGFTLVELSIVIVLIGLIVAGVTAGQSLVKQAQLRSIITESEQVRVATNAFLLEYNGLPGDITNGADYWAASSSGDGNKRITTHAASDEGYAAWEQLALAGLFPGSFSGASTGGVGVIGTNIPASKYTSAGITIVYDDGTSDATAGDGATSGGREVGKNVILFGSVSTVLANGTVLSVAQASTVDSKVDDGAPTSGSVVAVGSIGTGGTDCITTTVYNFDATDASPCSVAFTL